MDVLLNEFFNQERWQHALEKGTGIKGMNKANMRYLETPEVRMDMYKRIVSGAYQIMPPHQAQIPKDNGEFRTVYVNEDFDRILLSIYNDMLFELTPEMIHPSCKSYQKGIGCGKVVQNVSKEICKSNGEIIGFKADLSKYFDSVPIHFIDELFDVIDNKFGSSPLTEVVKKYYHTDLCFTPEGNLIEHYQSLKQGCAVASWIADVLLYDMDEWMSNLDGYYIRYSDDILYVGKDYEKAMGIMQHCLKGKGLKLNPKKVEYLSPDRWFKFLGFSIRGKDISISKGRLKTFQKEIESRTIKAPAKYIVKYKDGNSYITEEYDEAIDAKYRINKVGNGYVRRKEISFAKSLNKVNSYLYKGDGQYSWSTSMLPIVNVDEDIQLMNQFVMDCLRAMKTGKKKLGGLGYDSNGKDGVVIRGIGKNVTSNRKKTSDNIDGYYSLTAMQNALLTNRNAYEVLCMQM